MVKNVCVKTHRSIHIHSDFADKSYTKFASSHADVLARITSTEKIIELSKCSWNPVKVLRTEVLVEGCLLGTVEICDILGKIGFVLRSKETTQFGVEFLFSSG